MSSPPPRATIPTFDELPLVIDTPRLRLRPIEETDLEVLWPHVSDPKLSPFVTWSAHHDRDETRTYIRGARACIAAGTDLTWVIEHEGRASGCIGLHRISWTHLAWRRDRAELGYWIAIPLWNQGYMTEAATAVTRWAFETLGLHKITTYCIADNIGSKRVIEKIGYRYLCKAEEDGWRDGRWWAHLRYELTAGEWADTTRTLRFNRPPPGS